MDRVKPNEPILVFGKIELAEQSRLNVIAHHAECNDTAINALKADIQAMSEGEAKTTATKEMQAAQQMMAKNDMEGCKTHIHSAMEAAEK
jgi:hypothetical protein